MIHPQTGKWAPDLSPKGYEVLNDYNRFLMLSGPRKCSKTTSAMAKICRHLWENDSAMVAVVGKSIRSIKSSGIWQDLVVLETGIKQWLRAGIGFDYAVEPKITGDTKMSFFRIKNMHGGVSECQVHSLEHDHEVEQKFMGTRYSMFYLPEAVQFRDDRVLEILDDQLRIPSIPYEDHQILLDTNPAEEGPDHFLYRLFYRKCGVDEQPLTPIRASKYKVYNFGLDDNPFISDEEKQDLKDKYRHDQLKYKRFVEGKWERDTTGGVFEDVWSEQRHVVGGIVDGDLQILIPGQYSHEFSIGWDCGDVNHSATILCPRETDTETIFDIVDELCVVDRQISLADFCEGVMEKMDTWEKTVRDLYGANHKVVWRHWSDPSAADRYRAAADSFDSKIIRNISGGKIVLGFSSKGAGSVKRRKDLLRRLLFQNRIAVSAQCRSHIEMFRYLKPGPSQAEPIQRASVHKHCFDSLTYCLQSEAPAELDKRNQASVIRKPRIISV